MKKKAKVVARKRRESEPPSWLDLSGEEFAESARRLVSARGRAARVQMLREGLGGKFAARLLGEALRDTELQVECWNLVGQLWVHEAWQRHFRDAGVEGTPPSPRSFSKVTLAPIVQALLGLYGRDVLGWCVYACLISSGRPAKGIEQAIEQAIVARAFGRKAVIEALGGALKELEAEPKGYPRGIPGKITSLLSQSFSTGSTSGHNRSATAKMGSLALSRDQAATLIQTLLSVKLPGGAPPRDNLENALAETAWVEADEALARALQQTPALREAIREPTELGPRLRDQLGAIIQAVRASAAKRELEIEGDPGSEAAFDPVKHARDDPRVKAAERVRIITPTVFQGRGAYRRVLRVADVEPA
jgi:hypothetical protein